MTVWPVGTMMLRDQWSLTPTIVGPMVVLYPEFYEGTQVRSNSAAFRADLTTWTPVPWEDHWRSLGLFPEPEHLNWQT
jgi:hypothetical protein